MLYPFLNMTIKGVIWYQGEENTVVNPELYACVFPAMIKDWRRKWFESTNGTTEELFPFGFVQVTTHTLLRSKCLCMLHLDLKTNVYFEILKIDFAFYFISLYHTIEN